MLSQDFEIITRPWRDVCRECADEQPVWEEASPANGYHEGYRRKPHYMHPRLWVDRMELKTGEAEMQTWIDDDGAIKASVWLCVHNGPGKPNGRGRGAHPFGADPRGNWSYISPLEAAKDAWLALARLAEELEIESRALDCDQAINDLIRARAWATLKAGKQDLPRIMSPAEITDAVAARRAWFEERTKQDAEDTAASAAQAKQRHQDAPAAKQPKAKKETQYALF